MRIRPLPLLLSTLALACGSTGGSTGDSTGDPIIGGRETTRATFPATVGLANFDGKLICTATRVAPNAYMTAAHCLVDSTGRTNPAFEKGATVTLHKGDVIDQKFDNMVQPEVTGLAIAPNRDIDVGVLFVKHFGGTHPEIQTATIATAPLERVQAGQEIVIEGYGCADVAKDDGRRRLRMAIVKAGGADVFTRYLGTGMTKTFDSEIPIDVAGTGNATICFGDSGGGTYAPAKRPEDAHLRVIGVASSIDAPALAFGDPTIRFARLARVDDGGRFHVGTWLHETIRSGRSQPLADSALGAAILLRTPVVVTAATLEKAFFPLADAQGTRLTLEWEEATCPLAVRAARLIKSDRGISLVRGVDGTYSTGGPLAGPYEGIELDVDFSSFDRIDNEAAVCTLRVRAG